MYNKSIRIINLIFLLIFAIALIIPTLKIDTTQKIYAGKSYLKNFPKIYNSDREINENFGKDFDSWLASRFFTKEELMKIYTLVSCGFNINYCIRGDNVYDKKNSVLYNHNMFGYTKNKNRGAYNQDIISDNIQKLNNWCKARGIKLYFLIIPRRADFIEYNVPNKFYKTAFDENAKVVKYAQSHTNAKIIFPYDEMMFANKKSPVYFKTDHHWTPAGAYAGYLALMYEIKKDFQNVPVLKEDQLIVHKDKFVKGLFFKNPDGGSFLRNTGYPNFYTQKILDTDYLYYDIPLKENLKISNQSSLSNFNSETDFAFNYSGKNQLRVILIGDSFTSNLSIFLPYSFKELVVLLDNYRMFNFSEYKKIIEEYHPDIIIVNMRSVWLGVLKNFSKY